MERFTRDEPGHEDVKFVKWTDDEDIATSTVIFKNMHLPNVTAPLIVAVLDTGEYVLGDHHEYLTGMIVDKSDLHEVIQQGIGNTTEALQDWCSLQAALNVSDTLVFERELERQEEPEVSV